MKIGLLHFPFFDSNLGCVALTCSFINLLQEMDIKDLCVVRLVQNDVPEKITQYFNDVNFITKEIKIKDIRGRTIRAFKDCDVVFDVTYGDNFSDIYNTKFVLKTTLFKEMTLLSGTDLVLAPQTYGPFNNKLLEKFASHVIRKCKRIYTRDSLSTKYVSDISGADALTVTDLAFMLPYNKKKMEATERIRVGIGVSGLLWRKGFNNSTTFSTIKVDYQSYIESLIEDLRKERKYEIHLIPHVIADERNSVDDDWETCCFLHGQFPDTILSDKFETPMEAKGYIASMDVFTGARMHSTIAAFSSGVATIPFAYSRKFQGLYESIGYKYFVDGSNLNTKDAVMKTIRLINERDTLKDAVNASMKNVHNKLDIFKTDLKKLLAEYQYSYNR